LTAKTKKKYTGPVPTYAAVRLKLHSL